MLFWLVFPVVGCYTVRPSERKGVPPNVSSRMMPGTSGDVTTGLGTVGLPTGTTVATAPLAAGVANGLTKLKKRSLNRHQVVAGIARSFGSRWVL